VTIDASKDGVKFSCQGDIGNGSITLRQHSNVEKPNESIEIELTEPVSLTFSLKYLVNFCKASGLSNTVKICLSNEVPLLVEYGLGANSYLRFYLAPKVRTACYAFSSRDGLLTNLCRLATRSRPGQEAPATTRGLIRRSRMNWLCAWIPTAGVGRMFAGVDKASAECRVTQARTSATAI
jgi:hypothetical protein